MWFGYIYYLILLEETSTTIVKNCELFLTGYTALVGPGLFFSFLIYSQLVGHLG
jgi:hypothetical protein